MNKKQKQQLTNREFIARLEQEFDVWRRKKGKAGNTQNLIEYLIRHNFMQQCIINRFMCLSEYSQQLELTKSPKRPKGVKQWAVWAVEELLPLGETQIKANILNHRTHFKNSGRWL